MPQGIAPAIVRDVCKADKPLRGGGTGKILRTPTDTVSSIRGFGDSGYRVQVVNYDCPACQFDRMIRRIDVKPEFPDEVRYWCLNPNCVHFVRDELSHACKGSYPHRKKDEPTVQE